MPKTNTATVIFNRDDFKNDMSDGFTMFDSMLGTLNIEQKKWSSIFELEISINLEYFTLKTEKGKRVML